MMMVEGEGECLECWYWWLLRCKNMYRNMSPLPFFFLIHICFDTKSICNTALKFSLSWFCGAWTICSIIFSLYFMDFEIYQSDRRFFEVFSSQYTLFDGQCFPADLDHFWDVYLRETSSNLRPQNRRARDK